MIQTLKRKYGENCPIFTNEIIKTMNKYSRPRVFQLIKEAENNNSLIRFDQGVYYIPTKTLLGDSTISIEQVVIKKYILEKNKVYGIFGGITLLQNFLLTYQIPNTIEVITNNETTWIRDIYIKNRKVILKKSRVRINSNNVFAYTILELFTIIDIDDFLYNNSAKREVIKYIKENNILKNDVLKMLDKFPSKTSKKILRSGIIDEFA